MSRKPMIVDLSLLTSEEREMVRQAEYQIKAETGLSLGEYLVLAAETGEARKVSRWEYLLLCARKMFRNFWRR